MCGGMNDHIKPVLNAEDKEYQEPLDRMLIVHQRLKDNNFVYHHPTEQMAIGFIFETCSLIRIPNIIFK